MTKFKKHFRSIVTGIAIGTASACSASSDELGTWIGNFTGDEKRQIMDYLVKSDEVVLYYGSQIIKHDLDGNETADFVITVKVKGSSGRYGGMEHIVVLRTINESLSLSTATKKAFCPGFAPGRKLSLMDIDDDGLKDIVDQRVYDIGIGQPENHTLVLHNDGRQFIQVFSRQSFGPVDFQDLDGDGKVELVEPTNEFKIFLDSVLWPVVYRWERTGFREASSEFPEFYGKRLPDFRETHSAAKKKNLAFKEKRGKDNPIRVNIMRAMDVYIQRAQAISGVE